MRIKAQKLEIEIVDGVKTIKYTPVEIDGIVEIRNTGMTIDGNIRINKPISTGSGTYGYCYMSDDVSEGLRNNIIKKLMRLMLRDSIKNKESIRFSYEHFTKLWHNVNASITILTKETV